MKYWQAIRPVRPRIIAADRNVLIANFMFAFCRIRIVRRTALSFEETSGAKAGPLFFVNGTTQVMPFPLLAYFTGELKLASPRLTSAKAHQICTLAMSFT